MIWAYFNLDKAKKQSFGRKSLSLQVRVGAFIFLPSLEKSFRQGCFKRKGGKAEQPFSIIEPKGGEKE